MSKKSAAVTTLDASLVAAPAENALSLAAALSAADQEALVTAWIDAKNAGAVAAVARVDEAPAALRKAARRGLGILKSRGIAIPEVGHVTQAIGAPKASVEARALFPDGRGAQIWWIAKINSTGSTDVVEVTTMDRVGIVKLERGTPTAGNLRQIWHAWLARAGRAPMEVPVAWARARIADARAQSVAGKQVLPMGLDAASDLLVGDLTPDHKSEAHPIDALGLTLPADDAAKTRLDASLRLHDEPEFASWLPDDPVAVALLESINEKVQGIVGINPEAPPTDDQQKEIDTAVNTAIDEATDAYFDDARKRLYFTRLRDGALSLHAAGSLEKAIDALLVADAVKRAGVVSDRPSEIPFLRGLFVKVVAVAQQRAREAASR